MKTKILLLLMVSAITGLVKLQLIVLILWGLETQGIWLMMNHPQVLFH